jgi:hypothetical protein
MTGTRAVVFSDMVKDIPKAVIWREAIGLMARIKVPAICIAAHGSGNFLKRLGWQYQGPSEDGDVYEWQNSQH